MTKNTKSRILDAAESLFASKGYAATSIRDITNSAEVNLASVNYHFGTKEALVSAVFLRFFEPLDRIRREKLAEAKAAGLTTEAVVRAFLEPPFMKVYKYRKSKPFFMRFVGRIHMESNDIMEKLFAERLKPTIVVFADAFQEVAPELSKREILLRMRFMIGAMAHLCAGPDPGGLIYAEAKDVPQDALLEELICFAVAGMQAPLAAPARITQP